ncbi:hypothetical protein [Streptomyces uncialis]|uniref:STAS domain-containing protein n=1 Tax=Streptomyces uncialis TaxID=1048205 RepID=A0A1Q4V9I4_9ACTN|nr:hypothetical protein [Streptomyces uncialis]OKH94511.1 hypothetical protein AB852_09535 [Streptomyces uncialis]
MREIAGGLGWKRRGHVWLVQIPADGGKQDLPGPRAVLRELGAERGAAVVVDTSAVRDANGRLLDWLAGLARDTRLCVVAPSLTVRQRLAGTAGPSSMRVTGSLGEALDVLGPESTLGIEARLPG